MHTVHRPNPENRPIPRASAFRLRSVLPSRPRTKPTVHETSAGGLCIKVENNEPYVAVIMRRNRRNQIEWCLPKGHVETGETMVQAAIREIAEETGVTGQMICHINSVEYRFTGRSAHINKKVHHYLLSYLHGEITAEHDPDQEAEDATWMPLKKAVHLLTYDNEREVARQTLNLLYSEGADDTK